MVSSGLRDAGDVYLVPDDGWMEKQRDNQWKSLCDPVNFRRGYKLLFITFIAKCWSSVFINAKKNLIKTV